MKNATRRAEMLASFQIRRYLIADMTGVFPEDVKLETLADGAPALTHPVGWSVSLANKESYTVAALARAPSQIGVDIEVIREINWRPALSMTCSDAERDEIFAASENGPGDLRTFFRMWTLKEAVLKSTGEGFRAGPKRIETPLAILRAPGAGALNAFGDVFDFWTVDTGEMIISLVKKRA